ncbi:MAG: hypothetical protein H7306_15680 [Bacteriovorax sp.]|nr:hypothetical protein [Rhizobacter sp.]
MLAISGLRRWAGHPQLADQQAGLVRGLVEFLTAAGVDARAGVGGFDDAARFGSERTVAIDQRLRGALRIGAASVSLRQSHCTSIMGLSPNLPLWTNESGAWSNGLFILPKRLECHSDEAEECAGRRGDSGGPVDAPAQ